MVQPEVVRFAVIDGVLQDPPIYDETYKTNWLAVIFSDPNGPGKLGRRWCNRGNGRQYHVETLRPFDPIEFGADGHNGYGRIRNRWYGVVTAITETFIEVEQCGTGHKAIKRSLDVQEGDDKRILALEGERDALLAKARKLDEEIKRLRGERAGSAWSWLGEPDRF